MLVGLLGGAFKCCKERIGCFSLLMFVTIANHSCR